MFSGFIFVILQWKIERFADQPCTLLHLLCKHINQVIQIHTDFYIILTSLSLLQYLLQLWISLQKWLTTYLNMGFDSPISFAIILLQFDIYIFVFLISVTRATTNLASIFLKVCLYQHFRLIIIWSKFRIEIFL